MAAVAEAAGVSPPPEHALVSLLALNGLRVSEASGRDQQRAEFVTVQRDGMRSIVQPRPSDVGSRGVLEELLFDRRQRDKADPADFLAAA